MKILKHIMIVLFLCLSFTQPVKAMFQKCSHQCEDCCEDCGIRCTTAKTACAQCCLMQKMSDCWDACTNACECCDSCQDECSDNCSLAKAFCCITLEDNTCDCQPKQNRYETGIPGDARLSLPNSASVLHTAATTPAWDQLRCGTCSIGKGIVRIGCCCFLPCTHPIVVSCKTCKDIAHIETNKDKIDQVDAFGLSSLHYASWFGDIALVRNLILNRALLNIRGKKGFFMSERGHGVTWHISGDKESVLEGTFADNILYPTPLHFAILRGHKTVVEDLVGWGAKPDLEDCGKSPNQLCVDLKKPEMLEAINRGKKFLAARIDHYKKQTAMVRNPSVHHEHARLGEYTKDSAAAGKGSADAARDVSVTTVAFVPDGKKPEPSMTVAGGDADVR